MSTEKTSTTKTPSSQENIPQTLFTDYTMMHQSVVPRGQPRALPIPPRPLPTPPQAKTLSGDYAVVHEPVLPKAQPRALPVPPKPVQTPQSTVSQILPKTKLVVSASDTDYETGYQLLMTCQYKKALPYFEKAAKEGYPATYLRLWALYKDGGYVGPKDKIKSEKWYQKAATQIEWFKTEAQKGLVAARRDLGLIYYYGVGVEKDLKQAAVYYQLAADQGDARAQNSLGYCYGSGEGVEKDLKQAVTYFQLAADQGFARAQCSLGWCYEYGEGVEKDLEQAVKYYQLAADQGYANAQFNLGRRYEYGGGFEKDLEQAVKYYQLAADQGDADAQYALGLCYANGEWFKKDLGQAVKYYQLAADQGVADAQFNLGRCYGSGEGVEKDLKQAVKYHQLAADQGYVHAQFNLGLGYEYGEGVEKDLKQAMTYYQLAANQGHVQAQNKVEKEEEDSSEAEETEESLNFFLGTKRLPVRAITLGPFLGKGAFGQVYRGDWGTRTVALKKIDMEQAKKNFPQTDESEILESLQWEVSRLSTLSHPNLVQFYGVYKATSQWYLAMEFCEGGTLQSVLEKEQLSWLHRWQWALEITRGLAYLHGQGVLHRDLKAENILLDHYGRAKLADLGVAQVDALLQDKEAHVVEIGLQDSKFIAPERLANPTVSNKKTDIYALGLVFWQLVTGKVPRRLQMLSEAEKQVWVTGQSVRESIPADCPEVFKNVILSCWQHDPQKRVSADRLLKNLQNLTKAQHKETPWLAACDTLDELLHSARLEGLSYIAPYLTEHKVDGPIETYWQRYEQAIGQTSSAVTSGNAPLDLNQTLQNFIVSPGNRTLLLLGDSGLGKSLSVALLADKLIGEWRLHRQSPKTQSAPSYLPLLLRHVLKRWAHSELNQSFSKVMDYYGLQGVTTPLLIIIDGYDECQQDMASQNLAAQLGIPAQASVKLIVTCRSETVEQNQLSNRFAFQGQLETRYFLPFNIKQVVSYLNDRLSWTESRRKKYQKTLSNTPAVRTVLRNPFVLSLLVQSWETIAKQDFNRLNRWKIYEGFVTHWLTTQQTLLPTSVQRILKGSSAVQKTLTSDESETLLESFQTFAAQLAFTAFQQKGTALPDETAKQLNSPWISIKDIVEKTSRTVFVERQANLRVEKKRRALLTEDDYVHIMDNRLSQFQMGSPLKEHSGSYEFTHKSFFEYFSAKHLLKSTKADPQGITTTYLSLLNLRSLQEEPEILAFWQEGWEAKNRVLIEPLFEVIKVSKDNEKIAVAASNAATLLNKVRIPFAGRDLTGVHLPYADLSAGLLDHTIFYRSNLQGVNFSRAFLRSTDLREANLTNVTFGELPGLPMKGEVHCLVYSPDGQWLAVGLRNWGGNGTIELWRSDYSACVSVLEGHTSGMITSVAFDGTGTLLASGSEDDTVCLWDVTNQTLSATLTRHTTDSVTSVTFDGTGTLLASGEGYTICLWDVKTQTLRATLGHSGKVTSVAFDSTDTLLASGTEDKTIHLWNLKTQRLCARLTGHTWTVTSVVFDGTGTRLASGSYDETVRLWDVKTQTLIATLTGHTGWVMSVAFDGTGTCLASGSEDGTVCLWNVTTQRLSTTLKGHTDSVTSVAFDATGRHLASGSRDYTVRLWDVTTQRLSATLTGHTWPVTSVAFDSTGTRLASGSWDNTVCLWDVTTRTLSAELLGRDSLGSKNFDKTCRRMELDIQLSSAEEESINYVTSVAFDGTGTRLASGNSDNTVCLWDVTTQTLSAMLTGHSGKVTSVAFDGTDTLLASGAKDKTIHLWNLKTQRLRARLTGHTWTVTSVVFDGTGTRLASGSYDETVRLWDVKTQTLIATLTGHTGWVMSVAFDGTGTCLASGSEDGTVCLWNVTTQRLSTTLKGHTDSVTSVAFDATGRHLASGSRDCTVRLWDVTTQRLSATLTGHTWPVTSVVFDGTGMRLASGSEDKSILLWQRLGTDDTQWGVIWQITMTPTLYTVAALVEGATLSSMNHRLLKQRGAEGDTFKEPEKKALSMVGTQDAKATENTAEKNALLGSIPVVLPATTLTVTLPVFYRSPISQPTSSTLSNTLTATTTSTTTTTIIPVAPNAPTPY